MFCRFCGASVVSDSIFCAKCGKRLLHSSNPRLERISDLLRLRTPYPYAGALVLLAALWILWPGPPPFDYSGLQWTLQADRKLDIPEDSFFQQGFSLVLENAGSKAVREVPIELVARIEPPQDAEIAATFLGHRLSIMHAGKPLPLTVVLSDEVRPGSKRSFLLEGSIHAQTPFKVTYEVRQEGSSQVLTDFVVER